RQTDHGAERHNDPAERTRVGERARPAEPGRDEPDPDRDEERGDDGGADNGEEVVRHIIHPYMSTAAEVSIAHTDPINAKILAIAEDRIQGFVRDPVSVIAAQSGVDAEIVIERIRAMLRAGTIRRVRQTLMATNLAEGALVAWQYPQEKLEPAFEFM